MKNIFLLSLIFYSYQLDLLSQNSLHELNKNTVESMIKRNNFDSINIRLAEPPTAFCSCRKFNISVYNNKKVTTIEFTDYEKGHKQKKQLDKKQKKLFKKFINQLFHEVEGSNYLPDSATYMTLYYLNENKKQCSLATFNSTYIAFEKKINVYFGWDKS